MKNKNEAPICPYCEHICHKYLTNGRLNVWQCPNEFCMRFESEPFEPDVEPVDMFRKYYRDDHGGWIYEIYDQYGQPIVHSRAYSNKQECEKEAKKDLQRGLGTTGCATCTAIMFPPSKKVKGIIVE